MWTPSVVVMRPRLTSHLQDGVFQPVKAAAMCSVAAYFVNPGEAGREFAAKCAENVEFVLYRTIGTLNESSVLLSIMNLVHNFYSGQYAKCWQGHALAWRLVQALQLNWEHHSDYRQNFLRREINRRLAWQLFMIDRQLAGGFDEYILVREEHMRLRLPSGDQSFRENSPAVMDVLNGNKPTQCQSIAGYTLRLMNIRHHILW